LTLDEVGNAALLGIYREALLDSSPELTFFYLEIDFRP